MNKGFKIRETTIDDLNEILRLNFDLFKKEHQEFDKSLSLKATYSPKSKKYFKDRITKSNGYVALVEVEGKVVGYICGGIIESCSYRIKAKYAELENMIIEEKFRGLGLGAQLTNSFLAWCKKKKVDYVSVNAFTKNEESIEFYRSLGFNDYTLTLEKKIK